MCRVGCTWADGFALGSDGIQERQVWVKEGEASFRSVKGSFVGERPVLGLGRRKLRGGEMNRVPEEG